MPARTRFGREIERRNFFTNSPIVDEDDLESTWTGSWKPLTKATFDTGVAVVDEARAGLCWVTDED